MNASALAFFCLAAIGLIAPLHAVEDTAESVVDTNWFIRPEEPLPVECSDDKSKNKIVPVVLPIFTKKYALKISIAYEIPGEEYAEDIPETPTEPLPTPNATFAESEASAMAGPARRLLQSSASPYGAYFTVSLEKIDGEAVLDFGNNVRVAGFNGADGNRYEMVTPETGSTVHQHVGLWGVHKNKCGFAASIDVAVPTSGTLNLQVRDPENPDAEPEYVNLDVGMKDGTITEFGITLDHLSCLLGREDVYKSSVKDVSVVLDGPELKRNKEGLLAVEVGGEYHMELRALDSQGQMIASTQDAERVFGGLTFELILGFFGAYGLEDQRVIQLTYEDDKKAMVGKLYFEGAGLYQAVLVVSYQHTKICVRSYKLDAVYGELFTEVDTEHELVSSLCFCDPYAEFYGPSSSACQNAIHHFCERRPHIPACHQDHMHELLLHPDPVTVVGDYSLASMLHIVCPSVLLEPPETPKAIPHSPESEHESFCKLYAVAMGYGGGAYSLPVTNSCNARVVAVCEGRAVAAITQDYFSVSVKDERPNYSGYSYGKVTGFAKDPEVPGVFVLIISTTCPFKGEVKVAIAPEVNGEHVFSHPLEYKVGRAVPMITTGFRIKMPEQHTVTKFLVAQDNVASHDPLESAVDDYPFYPRHKAPYIGMQEHHGYGKVRAEFFS